MAMANSYFVDELVYVYDGVHIEYANVESVDENNVPTLKYRNNTKISQPNRVYHLPINPMILEDTGHYYMRNALLDTYSGPCYHHSLNNGYNVKVIFNKGGYKLVKEKSPGIVERIEEVETIGDIQLKIGFWFGDKYVIDANSIMAIWPHSREEILIIDRCLDDILHDDPAVRMNGYRKLLDFYPKSRFNKDTCLYWLAEYNLNEYMSTLSQDNLTEAKKYFEQLKGTGSYEVMERKMIELGVI